MSSVFTAPAAAKMAGKTPPCMNHQCWLSRKAAANAAWCFGAGINLSDADYEHVIISAAAASSSAASAARYFSGVASGCWLAPPAPSQIGARDQSTYISSSALTRSFFRICAHSPDLSAGRCMLLRVRHKASEKTRAAASLTPPPPPGGSAACIIISSKKGPNAAAAAIQSGPHNTRHARAHSPRQWMPPPFAFAAAEC